MTNDNIAFLPAIEQARLIREKEVSSVELVNLYLERIEEHNQTLNAYITVAADQAREAANQADADLASGDAGPFAGVPISIKDLNATAGIRTTYGTATMSDNIPVTDDAVVARIRKAGFVILGKTNTPEFGTTPWTQPPAYGPCANPWDITRTSGGSSGGAASALAAGLCAVSQGSDGGGSVRIPSSVCGVYGIKPSRGRVSNAPGPVSMLSQDGPIGHTVADAAALLDVMSGYETGDAFTAPPPLRPFLNEATTDPGRLRIAYSVKPAVSVPVAEANVAAVVATAAKLSDLGHDVFESDPPFGEGELEAFLKIWPVGRAEFQPLPPLQTLDPVNRALIEMADGISAVDYRIAWHTLERNARRLVAFFDDVDVLISPVCATPPPLHYEFRDPDGLTEFFSAVNFVPFPAAWNTTGQPAASCPLYLDESGLPIGVQVVGRPFDEAAVIRVSAQLEAEMGFLGTPPGY